MCYVALTHSNFQGKPREGCGEQLLFAPKLMGRDMTFTSAPSAPAGGWKDGVPVSNAEASRMRAMNPSAISPPAPGYDWRSQPVGGRTAQAAARPASNPFESRLFSRAAAHASVPRMHGQHGPAMTTLSEFAGAAGVTSTQAAAAAMQREPRALGTRADFAHAAGSTGGSVDKDMLIYHQGPQGRRVIANEGTVRTKELVGAAAAVTAVGSS